MSEAIVFIAVLVLIWLVTPVTVDIDDMPDEEDLRDA